MKILLCNKFYYPRGGDCNYVISLEKLLTKNFHDVAIFSMHHANNLFNKWDKYWLSSIDYNSKKNLVESIARPIYSREVKEKFTQLLNDFQPDVIHLNNIHSQISPIIAEIAKKSSIPVVWTLHDYKLLCPKYDCVKEGALCELCFKNKINVVWNNCIKRNYVGSIIGFLEAVKWNRNRLSRITDYFICPSEFMKNKMIQGGFDELQMITIGNFFNGDKYSPIGNRKEDYYCYFGRLSSEKGVETLLKAAKKLKQFKLKVIGTGPLEFDLKKKYNLENIEFTGFQTGIELQSVVAKALFAVIPSEWYENNPLSIMEAYSLGIPVVGAKIGGIPEMIQNGETGFLFNSGNVKELIPMINYLMTNKSECIRMGRNAILHSKKYFSEDKHYSKLIALYQDAIERKRQ